MYSLQESASKDKAKQLLQNPSLFVALQLKNVEIQPKKQYFPHVFVRVWCLGEKSGS